MTTAARRRLDRPAVSAGMVAADVNAPEAPSRTSHASAPKAATGVARLAVELLGQAGHEEQQREHDGDAHHHGDEAGGAELEVAQR